MLNFLSNYGLFLLEVLTIVAAILMVLFALASTIAKSKIRPREKIAIRKINDKYKEMGDAINEATLDKKGFKALLKRKKIEERKQQRAAKAERD